MMMLGNTLPDKFKQRHGSWVHQLCRSCETSNTTVAKSILKLAISFTTSPDDLCIAVEVAKELQNVIGLEKSDTLEVSESSYMIINQSTSASVTSCILQSIDSAIVDMDWATKKLKKFQIVSQKNIHLNHDAESTFGLSLEEALYSMAESKVRILSSFVLMNLKGEFSLFKIFPNLILTKSNRACYLLINMWFHDLQTRRQHSFSD